jgi:hypothetical protein
MIVDYGGDRETNIVSAPMGAGVRVSVCFSATMSVLSSGGTCGRIVEYGGDIETSTASVPTVFFFVSLQQFLFCLAELHVQGLWSTKGDGDTSTVSAPRGAKICSARFCF